MDLNNICTTEDAFDQFQAGTMYEEDEFITLSELVTPSCASIEVIDSIVPKQTKDSSHVPTSEPENHTSCNKPVILVSEQMSSSTLLVRQNDSQTTTVTPIKVTKKRSTEERTSVESESNKKIYSHEEAKHPDHLELNYDMIIGEDSPTETFSLKKDSTKKKVKKPCIIKNIKTATSIAPRKRGRPAKKPIIQTNVESISSTAGNANLPSKDNVPHKISRRGRKRKNNTDETNTFENMSDSCGITSSNCTEGSSVYCVKNTVSNKSEEREADFTGLVNNTTKKIAENTENSLDSTISKNNYIIVDSTASELKEKSDLKSNKKSNKTGGLTLVKRKKKLKRYVSKEEESIPADTNDHDDNEDADGMDDLCLSKLKKTMENNSNVTQEIINEQHPDISTTVQDNVCVDISSKKPTGEDDKYVTEEIEGGKENTVDVLTDLNNINIQENSLLEESSKRPIRRKAKKTFHYEEEPDEDPFANMESSDDEPRKGKKGKKYYSDDEYIPNMEHGRKRQSSESEVELSLGISKKEKKKKYSKSPKKNKKYDNELNIDISTVSSIDHNDDLEDFIENSAIKTNEEKLSCWGSTNEFQKFLEKKVGTDVRIKKAKSDTVIAPLQIPVLNPNEPKKCKEEMTQTNITATRSASVQTDSKYEIPMKNQVKLTPEQSVKACEFLTNIVKTTAELGQLMTQKSEDFIEKKINTKHVTDTFKMDYCVKKSFLLFKLAKHNLIQMEEDLAKQYEEFLKVQDLMQHREKQEVISAKVKQESDSDCEIVEVLSDSKKSIKTQKKKEQAFNPKTVFLNKELSIKIAKKKPTVEPKVKEKLNVKGRHTLWINNSIMVKKVKPNQSFLAQDSRNKKPPDTCFVTLKMVNDFFEAYNRHKALSICAPYITSDWATSNKVYACYYSTQIAIDVNSNVREVTNATPPIDIAESLPLPTLKTPKTLFVLCVLLLKRHLKFDFQDDENHDGLAKKETNNSHEKSHNCPSNNSKQKNIMGAINNPIPQVNISEYQKVYSQPTFDIAESPPLPTLKSPKTLLVLCVLVLKHHLKIDFQDMDENHDCLAKKETNNSHEKSHNCPSINSKQKYIMGAISNPIPQVNISENKKICSQDIKYVETLSDLCLLKLRKQLDYRECTSSTMKQLPERICDGRLPEKNINSLNNLSLQTLCYKKVIQILFRTQENINTYSKENYSTNVKSLFSLCVNLIQNIQISHQNTQTNKRNVVLHNPLSLCNIALDHARHIFKKNDGNCKPKSLQTINQQMCQIIEVKPLSSMCLELCERLLQLTQLARNLKRKTNNVVLHNPLPLSNIVLNCVTAQNEIRLNNNKLEELPRTSQFATVQPANNMKTLSDICLEFISFNLLNTINRNGYNTKYNIHKCMSNCMNFKVLPLKQLCFNKIVALMEEPISKYNNKEKVFEGYLFKESETLLDPNFNVEMCITINDINTVSEEIFNNDYDSFDNEDNYDDSPCELEDRKDGLKRGIDTNTYENCGNEYQENPGEGNEWVSQIQMAELRSCVEGNNSENNLSNINQEEIPTSLSNFNIINSIKMEPSENVEDITDTFRSIKDEPQDFLSQTEPSEKNIAKVEDIFDRNNDVSLDLLTSNSYDVDAFETFVSTSKLMYALTNGHNIDEDEIYSQSNNRIHRQYEPDYNNEMDNFVDNMSLLIPQTSEQAKDRLMNSSSDEESRNKKNDKKKPMKKKGKVKKNGKDILLSNNKPTNDIAILTKKMKNKIRQEDKPEDVDEDADIDNMPLLLRKEKDKNTLKDKELKKSDLNTNIIQPDKELDTINLLKARCENEIQCNDVDSTENLEARKKKRTRKNSKQFDDEIDNSPMENNMNCCNSENLELPMIHEDNSLNNAEDSAVVDKACPIELLECEPTIPVHNNVDTNQEKCDSGLVLSDENDGKSKMILRNGWKCYSVDHTDTKLYQYACIVLDKLPESFVETYLRYVSLNKNEHDLEIDRLTNLQTLNRTHGQERNQQKQKSKIVSSDASKTETKVKGKLEDEDDMDNYDELLPSEDEDEYDTDEVPPVQGASSENYLAKNLLMDDNDSEPENVESTNSVLENNSSEDRKIKRKVGPKSKCKVRNEETKVEAQLDIKDPKEEEENAVKLKVKLESESKVKKEDNGESLLLTADRMMNSELALLHAPVAADQGIEQPVIVKESTKKYNTRPRTSPKGHTTTVHIRKDDDSSSEEEKQWVTTKEKLLKRLEKKQQNNVDDAKRAKIVSEFIERRGEGPDKTVLRVRPRRARNNKRMLERKKQMKILARELFGGDSAQSRKYSQTYAKGRRNIRKVIDKKSLSSSTVLANMQEFERKRRLSIREAKLRERLGCEDDVNVVVINEELCLEYDFERNQPCVSVHQYFTKVMKAHQYEGVKFMWDACFETVETVRAGGGGGGCILAHCMGLGKTLQVLALLHTVLMHPKLGMRRVLVCCPLSTVLNWVDEIHKWIGPVTDQIKVFELSKLKKTYQRAFQLEDWYTGGGIFIISYELFRSLSTLDPSLDDVRPTIVEKIRTALLDPGPDIIICDEGHLLKNDMSVLAVAMSRVVTKRRIVLTGTPMQNNLREYYCMMNFIKPNLLGTYPEYSNRFENPIMNGQHRDSLEEDIKLMQARTHILHKVLEGCLQRQEASVLYPYLPKKYEYTVFISLTTCQWDLYKHYMNNFSRATKQSVLKDFHVLQKIWSHPQVLHNFLTRPREEAEKIKEEKVEDELAREDLGACEDAKPRPTDVWWLQHLAGGSALDRLDTSHKFLVVFRLLDECVALGDKVLIFSTSLYTLDALEYFLRRINGWSLGKEYYRLDGSVPAEVRQKWCREFNSDNNVDTKLFLISTRAGCLGLNMTAANRVIILDTSWNPAHDIQSIFRVYRFGQRKDCYVYRLVALGTMEQKMYERSVTKQAVACRVVDEQQIDRHYNMAELGELYKYDEEGSSVGAGLAAGVHDTALLRVAAALCGRGGALHAVREHDSLLRDTADEQLPEHERDEAWHQFQQEHADTQIKQLAVKMPKKFRVKVKKESDAEVKNEPSTSGVSETPAPKTKTKRGRPFKDRSQPSTSSNNVVMDETTESTIIEKIKEVLIQHKVTMTEPSDIAQMIQKVRDYTASNHSDVNADPVAQCIARVLRLQAVPSTPPPLTNTMPARRVLEETESILGNPDNDYRVININSDASATEELDELEESLLERMKRKRKIVETETRPTTRRQKRLTAGRLSDDSGVVTTHNVNELTDTSDTNDSVSNKSSRKRKTYDKTSESQDIVSTRENPVIEALSPEIPVIQAGSEKPQAILSTPEKPPTLPATPEKYPIIKARLETGPSIRATKKLVPVVQKIPEYTQSANEDSIVLSDDEMPLCSSDKATVSETSHTAIPTIPVKPVVPEEEVVPLPRSLLTDQKFIKIVAHMYVSGNPMLDEDAAFLAAQYSTSRAMAEVKTTGKDICSGRLHEIALKVFGKDTLRKIGNAANNKAVQPSLNKISTKMGCNDTNEKPTPTTSQVVQPKPAVSNISETKTKSKPKAKDIVNTPVVTNRSQEVVKQPDNIEVDKPTPSVVPVGMFKGPATMGTPSFGPVSREESILPDDNNVNVTSMNANVTSNPLLQTMLSKSKKDPPFWRRNSKELILSSVSTCHPKKNGLQLSTRPIILKKSLLKKKILAPIFNVSNGKLLIGSVLSSGESVVCNVVAGNVVDEETEEPIASTEVFTHTQPSSSISKPTNLTSNSTPIKQKAPLMTEVFDTISLDSDDEDVIVTSKPTAQNVQKIAQTAQNVLTKSQTAQNVQTKEQTAQNVLTKSQIAQNVQTKEQTAQNVQTKEQTAQNVQTKEKTAQNVQTKPPITEPVKEMPSNNVRLNDSDKHKQSKERTAQEKYIDKIQDLPPIKSMKKRIELLLVKSNEAKVTPSITFNTVPKKTPVIQEDFELMERLSTEFPAVDISRQSKNSKPIERSKTGADVTTATPSTSSRPQVRKEYSGKSKTKNKKKTTVKLIDLDMIDLTDVAEEAKAQEPECSKTTVVTITGSREVHAAGKSSVKPIVFKPVDLTGFDEVTASKPVATTSTKRSTIKRETNVVKKRKTETPIPTKTSKALMSLKDFNFDDFDDIIELE